VNINAFEDAKSFTAPAWLGALLVWIMMKTNGPARKIFERHTAMDEAQQMFYDVLETGEALNVPMPHYTSLKKFVDHPPEKT
jgi:hypothetical protein